MVAVTQRLSTSGQRRRWGFLGCAATPLIGAVFYNHGYHLPITCPIQQLAGVLCPTCGMTRSLMATVQGNLGLAFSYHLFGPLLVVGCVVAVLHIALELKSRCSVQTFYTRIAASRIFWEALFGLLLTYHGCRLLGLVTSITMLDSV